MVSCFEPGFFNIPIATAIFGLLSASGSHAPSIRLFRNALVIVIRPVLEEASTAALNAEPFPSVTYVFCSVYAELEISISAIGTVILIIEPEGMNEAGVNVIV